MPRQAATEPKPYTAMSTSAHISASLLPTWVQQHWGWTPARLEPLPGEIDFNFYLEDPAGRAFTFKISRPDANRGQAELQQAALQWIDRQSVAVALPYPVPALDGQLIVLEQDSDGAERMLRMVNWVPGKVLGQCNPRSLDLLYELGRASASVCKALQGFDHPAAHRFFKWDIAQMLWTKAQLHTISEPAGRALLSFFIAAFETQVVPQLPALRQGVIHNDANDYNILVADEGAEGHISGIIDFGDAIYSPLINELAVAVTYGVMDKPKPLEAAAAMVRGFHEVFPLEEREVALLYYLVAARLVISLTTAAINKIAEPENTYLLISERPAWDLLKKWRAIPPALAHYTFRQACGWEPCPQAIRFREWAFTYTNPPFVLDLDLNSTSITALDLGVGSPTFGNNHNFNRIDRFDRTIRRMLEDADAPIGIGGYGEVRPFYTTDAYQVAGNSGPEWRTVHLGLDVWGEAGLPVRCPLDGIVESIKDNQGDCDYGPTIIIRHEPVPGLCFYTLYGHLSSTSLDVLRPGDTVKAGQQIAWIGPYPTNGNWPPHLHFQIILDLLGWVGDFPGVAFPNQWEVWRSICPDPAYLQPSGLPVTKRDTGNAETLQLARQRHLGKSLSLSYQRPLHMVRGFGPYLYDQTARRYLDTVNNVAHVGHEHPAVVAAGQRQMGLLNTNTRYLHENITTLAEELLATLPPELSVVFFVNSGSEANELALRMARSRHGHSDMIAVEVGYHGNTGACIDVSSYKFDGKGGKGVPPHTQIVPIPDTYRGLYRAHDQLAGRKYAEYLTGAIERIQSAGRNVAGFICESILSCGGQIELPASYLKSAYEKVRQAGGLCIADEVQVGFGRVGSHFWGFELQGVIPDIVTMGKPFGNGHPLAAVACTREVADAFANGMEYFNTFGGNPVSCAIGTAVLEVIRQEQLQDNALQTGLYLRQGLLALQKRFPLIGDVRGPGLFQGIELVKDIHSLSPAAAEADYIANHMRDLGILMSTDGPLHNVLKIKPPLCFYRPQVDFLIESLEQVLQHDLLQPE